MTNHATYLKREEILLLASQTKLMIADGSIYYLNDMASEKQLMAFARLLESKFVRPNDNTHKIGPMSSGLSDAL